MKRSFLLVLMILLTLEVSDVWGQIPQTMAYQGFLTDTMKEPVPDGLYTLTFRMYDANGQLGWEEKHEDVPVVLGLFNVILGGSRTGGERRPLEIDFDKSYWLGISIGEDGIELTPRIPLSSSAYSLASRAVFGHTNVFPSDGNVGIGTLAPTERLSVDDIIHTQSGGIRFPDGTIQSTSRIIPSGVIVMWSGSIDNIPQGWVLCDGRNGTPDLVDRFIVGAAGQYIVGDTGGSSAHILTIDEMPRHGHPVWLGRDWNEGPGSGNGINIRGQWVGRANLFTPDQMNPEYMQGGSSGHENRPPYFALAYIMKL